jgi:sec-independent protein translocase protein TatB
MDSIFGIGPMELALILIIAGLVMGPERMVQTARWLGQKVSEMQAISHNLRNQLDREIAALDKDGGVRTAVDEVQQIGQQLQKEVADTRQQLNRIGGQHATTPKPASPNDEPSPSIAPSTMAMPSPNEPTAPPPITIPSPPPSTIPRLREIADDPE